ncbi:MAG: hypothetical protein HOP12_11785 [Candidatus Eisenbacteria bacterium]|uniref:Uncharacterized protein n=1 Tax=Eiseniibacteriota bacterium TaxID=2212470 RepID=A0A849SQC0_UNCEI|nr:hypothetical protein [Candidatus Eisenbacteria bacterium]
MSQERRKEPRNPRATFDSLAREAIERCVPETRQPTASWHQAVNHAWVRWPIEGGRWRFLALMRHLDWISGEVGFANDPVDMQVLALHPGSTGDEGGGARARLGDLLGEGDRWWRGGAREHELVERLEWMALQLHVKGPSYFHHHPLVARSER